MITAFLDGVENCLAKREELRKAERDWATDPDEEDSSFSKEQYIKPAKERCEIAEQELERAVKRIVRRWSIHD
jgi:hypothetical protein